MGIQKRYLSEVDTAGSYSKMQTLTSTSTATPLNSYGVTLITAATTAGSNAFTLGAPKTAGVHKYVAVTLGTTDSVAVSLSTAVAFWGSTNSTVTFSTGAGEKHLALVAASATSWAVLSQSTGVTFSA